VCVCFVGDYNTTSDGVTYKFGDSDSDNSGGEFGRIIVTLVDALRRNTDQDRLAFGVRTSQRHATLVHVHSATSADFLHVDLVTTPYTMRVISLFGLVFR